MAASDRADCRSRHVLVGRAASLGQHSTRAASNSRRARLASNYSSHTHREQFEHEPAPPSSGPRWLASSSSPSTSRNINAPPYLSLLIMFPAEASFCSFRCFAWAQEKTSSRFSCDVSNEVIDLLLMARPDRRGSWRVCGCPTASPSEAFGSCLSLTLPLDLLVCPS